MKSTTKPYKDINDYIRRAPKEVQGILKKVRETIRATAPGTEEAIRYMLPTFILNGKNLVHFGAFAKHIGFYPTPSGIRAFTKELSSYQTSKGAVQFPADKPIPSNLITRIVKYRLKDSTCNNKARGKQKDGAYTHRHKDGNIWAKGKIKAGKMDGFWVWFRKDGSKMRSGYFKNDKQTGEWTTYDKTGRVVKVTKFK